MRVKAGKFQICLLMMFFILLGLVANVTPARAEESEGEGKQDEELVVNLRDGFVVFCDEGLYDNAKACTAIKNTSVKICEQSQYDWCVFSADVDGDGTVDFETGGYNWSEEEYPTPFSWYIVPTVECSVRGTVTLPVGEIEYEFYRKYTKVTLIFPDAPIKDTYSITVENGHAEKNGQVITSAAPGDWVTLVPDVLDGKYVSSWTSEITGSFSRYDSYSCVWRDSTAFPMPATDIVFKAKVEKQQPLSFDMTSGFCKLQEDPYASPKWRDYDFSFAGVDSDENSEYKIMDTFRLDFDGDGSFDVAEYISEYSTAKSYVYPVHVYLIPLSTSSITGKYTTTGKSILPYWPYTFIFPQGKAEKLYPITVEGGHAEDMQGRTITEAAPGEAIRIIYKGEQGGTVGFDSSPAYENLYKTYMWNGERSQYRLRDEILMPACALSYKALPNEGKTLYLSFYLNGDYYQANLTDSIADALKKSENGLNQVLCWYAGYGASLSDRVLNLNYYSWGDYYSLEYSLPEPFITDEETYTTVQVRFQGKWTYPITCTDEAIRVYYSTVEIPGARILESAPNQILYVDKSGLNEPEGYMFAGFEAKDFWMEYNGYYWRLSMPDHAIELKPVYTKVDPDTQTPLTIDLSEGHFNVEDQEILKSIAKTGISYERSNDMYDLDGDGKWDIHVNADLHIIRILSDYSCGEYFTIETGNHGQKYFPITFVNKPKADTETGVTPTVTPAKNDEKPTKNETTPTGAPAAANNKSKSKKGGALLVVLAILAMILVFGGVVGFNTLKNRKEEEQRELRCEKIAALRRQRAMEAEEYEEPSYEQTAEQPKEQDEPSEEEEDEDYL